MNKEIEIISLENRIQKIRGTGKYIKNPGVLKKLERKLLKLKQDKN